MRLRIWVYRIATVWLSLLLSACTAPNLLSDFSDNSWGPSSHSTQTASQAAAKADNPASKDYFNNEPGNTDSSNNMWVAIRKNFKINHDTSNPQVQAQIAWFVHNQKYLDRTARRAAPYMYYIYQQVKARNLPSELVLLPIMESAYNPFASSYAGAAGLWQLEPGTARNFGVRQDWWYDGRRDITSSTKAALDYFTYLQNFFDGNWLLAIAAYNTGQGNVEAAVQHNARLGLSTDFWNLPLSEQTRAYVPRLLALAAIVADPSKYGIQLPPISNSPYLGEVEISSQITLEKAANLAGVSLDELKILNPGYRHNTLDPNRPYKLLLPLDRVNFFRENLLRGTSRGSGLWGRYKVQSGDTWKKISKQFSTPITLLQEINKLHDKTPPVGEILLIPENQHNETAIATAITQQAPNSQNTQNQETDNTIAAPSLSAATDLDKSAMQSVQEHNEPHPRSEGIHLEKIIHTVRPGEDLYKISHAYGVSPDELARWNHLTLRSEIRVGEKLTIWRRDEPKAKSHIQSYTVKSGDTIYGIARKFRVSVADIKRWNAIKKPSDIHPGRRLVIY